jgi:hypothetical protein
MLLRRSEAPLIPIACLRMPILVGRGLGRSLKGRDVDQGASGVASPVRAAAFPTDLTNAEWGMVRPLLPRPAGRGRPPAVNRRKVLNTIRQLAQAGCGRPGPLASCGTNLCASVVRRR